MDRRVAVLFVLALATAGCGGDGPTPAPASPPVSSTPEPTPTPASPGLPDPRAVPVESLLRPGAIEQGVLYGEMNGVAPEEIVVLSATPPDDPDLPGTPYLDAFAWDPASERWVTVFDATRYRDGAGRGPVLAEHDAVAQDVPVLQFLDFAGDGAAELVVGVQTFGASAGPLDLWVLSWLSESFTAEFRHSTERGGRVSFAERTLTLETGVYRPGDPGCCPSAIERLLVGWDAEDERIEILERTEEEVPQY